MTFKSFGVIGGGAWGTALAQTLCASGLETTLWCREAETVDAINRNHVNDVFLPGVPLHKRLKATGDISDIVEADAILLVSPAQHVRSVIELFRNGLRADTPVIICAKGIEQSTGKLMVDVVREELPQARLAILSGPSFAADVARGLPTAVTLASLDRKLGEQLADTIGNRTFRIYWTNDMTGVELGGALKNVLAIAAGIVEGKALGASAHAALVTRGFAELRRFAEAHGAQTETLMGLSGFGDLILTCGSKTSRNMSLGVALGQGRTLSDVLGERSSVTEGVYTAKAVCELAKTRGIEMPITEAVSAILSGQMPVDEAIEGLMHRPQKAED